MSYTRPQQAHPLQIPESHCPQSQSRDIYRFVFVSYNPYVNKQHHNTHTHTHIYIYTYAHILIDAHKYRLLHTRIFVSIQHSKLRGWDRTGSHRTYIFFNVDSGHYQGRCPPDLLYLSCLQCIKSSFNLAGYKGIIYPSWRIDVGYMEMHVF